MGSTPKQQLNCSVQGLVGAGLLVPHSPTTEAARLAAARIRRLPGSTKTSCNLSGAAGISHPPAAPIPTAARPPDAAAIRQLLPSA